MKSCSGHWHQFWINFYYDASGVATEIGYIKKDGGIPSGTNSWMINGVMKIGDAWVRQNMENDLIKYILEGNFDKASHFDESETC